MKNSLSMLSVTLVLFCILATIVEARDETYTLYDGSKISQSDIISIQNYIVLEYNKNFEHRPPENKLLYQLFTLNQSFTSNVLLSYSGMVGFEFQDSRNPTMNFNYFDKNQEFVIGNVIVLDNTTNAYFFSVGFNDKFYKYIYSTEIKSLTRNDLRNAANNFFSL